uniref:Bidirectional sugar transporter SWEET n=2 Tax=Leersia perrieri TaxID=77586 RepID=A0A0D9UYD8_9ORYZ
MVSNTVRVAVGILGNAASMLLYAAPILTFRRVVKKGSVEEFSCVPYILALFNCLLYTWYGLPVVSSGWENSTVSSINGLGILLEIAFISIYTCMRKVFVGSIGLVASISMYSSPMVAAKQVITTKSVEFMPFYLSLFSFLSSALWMIYGLLGKDLFIASPNFVGCPMGILQLVLYCIYRKSHEEAEKLHDIDQENGLKVVTTHKKITGSEPEVQKD